MEVQHSIKMQKSVDAKILCLYCAKQSAEVSVQSVCWSWDILCSVSQVYMLQVDWGCLDMLQHIKS